MIKFNAALKAWGTSIFQEVLKADIQQIDAKQLPLQEGLTQSNAVAEGTLDIVVLNVTEDTACIHVKTGIFYAGVNAGSCCADDPSPLGEVTEYCEVQFDINKNTAESMATLLDG